MNEELAQIEMPRYQCHKEVWALQIKDTDITGTMISFVDDKYAPRVVGADWIARHKPQPNGYFVVYQDGYESYSPQKAFEEGYNKIESSQSHSSSNEELAKKAYAAYGQTDNLKLEGLPMPEWENFPEAIQRAWTNAAIAITTI